MTIGVALVLIAIGAILRFAVATTSTHGINLHTIGVILMLVGVLGVVVWALVWAPWARSRRTTYRQRPPIDEERHVYRSDAGDYEDQYPR
jgi:uncharacterized membrane protein YidH (DUF202 family)